MILKKREKILLGAVVGIVVLAGLGFFFMLGDPRPDDFLQKEQERLDMELKKNQNAMNAAAEQARRMEEWRKRSLPPDPAIARSLYQDWLRVLCDKSGLHGLDIHSEETEPHRDIYTRIPFSIRAHANMDEVLAFLYGFYKSGNLHQIRRLDMKPQQQNSRNLEIHITIEALSLPDAASKDKLTTDPGQGLKLPDLAAYRTLISGRNFFAAYVPPRAAPPPSQITASAPQPTRRDPPPPSFDFAKFAVVTGFTTVDGTDQVWLQDRIAGKGKTLLLKEGDRFEIAGLKGQVRKIDPEGEVILEFDGKLRALRAEQNLRDGKEVKEAKP